MRLSYSFLLLLLLTGIGFTACEDDSFDPVLSLDVAPEFTAPSGGESYVVTEDNLNETMATFTWNAAEFGFAAGIQYNLVLDLAGNDFADPLRITPAFGATEVAVENAAVNNFLLGREIEPGTATDLDVRVSATVGLPADGNTMNSTPITITVTPYAAPRTFPVLYVPGAYQGWDPGSATQLYDVTESGRYEGYVFFPDAGSEFKFTDAPNWDNGDFGDNEGDGTLETAGGNISHVAAGMHRINVDINALTYEVMPTNWGLIGSATPTGWDSDTDLAYDATTGILSITLDLIEGEVKFRANDAWDLDFGDNDADGALDYGGANIAVPTAGNYTVELLLNQPIYGYNLIRN